MAPSTPPTDEDSFNGPYISDFANGDILFEAHRRNLVDIKYFADDVIMEEANRRGLCMQLAMSDIDLAFEMRRRGMNESIIIGATTDEALIEELTKPSRFEALTKIIISIEPARLTELLSNNMTGLVQFLREIDIFDLFLVVRERIPSMAPWRRRALINRIDQVTAFEHQQELANPTVIGENIENDIIEELMVSHDTNELN